MENSANKTTVKQDTQKPSFFSKDFFQKLLLLIIGFLFTTLVGVFLSYYFQARTNFHTYQNALIESERKVAKDIFEDVTTGMDERIYYAQIVNDDYSFHSGKEVLDEKWNNYKKAMDHWNMNINKRSELIELYFGSSVKRQLGGIHLSFIELNLKLNKAKTGNDDLTHADIKSRIELINHSISELSIKLIAQIQKDSVGRIPSLQKSGVSF